jgi:hypothetical protein
MISSHCIPVLLAATLAIGTAPAPAPSPAQTVPAAWPSDQKGLDALGASLVDQWMSAVAAKDASRLESMMLPCFQRISWAGSFDRAAEIEAIKALDAKSPKVSDVKVTRVGESLVVTCQVAVEERSASGPLPSEPSCRLGVWQLQDRAWKLAAWATLHMPSARPAPSAPRFTADEGVGKEGAALVTRFLEAQRAKDLGPFDAMMADGMQVINFRGQKTKEDLVKGASHVKADAAVLADVRATRCNEILVVTCTLTMGQKMGFTTLPAEPAPFLAVFQGTGDAVKVIAMANTNKPK